MMSMTPLKFRRIGSPNPAPQCPTPPPAYPRPPRVSPLLEPTLKSYRSQTRLQSPNLRQALISNQRYLPVLTEQPQVPARGSISSKKQLSFVQGVEKRVSFKVFPVRRKEEGQKESRLQPTVMQEYHAHLKKMMQLKIQEAEERLAKLSVQRNNRSTEIPTALQRQLTNPSLRQTLSPYRFLS